MALGGFERRDSTDRSLAVIGPARVLRTTVSGQGQADVGLLAHTLISTHLPLVRDGVDRLLAPMLGVAMSLIESTANRKRVIATEAAGLAHRYLTRWVPSEPWQLLGVEFDTSDGYVDAAWTNPVDGRVLYDEIKTSRVATRALPSGWTQQARRYSAAGKAGYGSAFIGTRLLPINQAHLVCLVRSTGPSLPLSPTPEQPLRPRDGA